MKNKKYIIVTTFIALLFVFLPLVQAQESTESADTSNSVRERVQEKIDTILQNPKAFIGVITDITDQTFQIRNEEGQIQQVSLSDNTNYTKPDASDDITLEDIAIGDYQAALGYLENSEVLSATRVLIVDEPGQITRKSLLGSVSDIANSSLTVTTFDNSYEVVYGRYTDILMLDGDEIIETDATDVEDGDEIIIIGNLEDDGTVDAYHIQIVNKAEIASPESEE